MAEEDGQCYGGAHLVVLRFGKREPVEPRLDGFPPRRGKPLDGMDYFRIQDNRIIRTRHVENWLGALIRLGAFGA